MMRQDELSRWLTVNDETIASFNARFAGNSQSVEFTQSVFL